jgi:hypothetical protein
MYVKTLNNEIQEFPYNVRKLKEDNPNTSFPDKLSEEQLADWGLYLVAYADKPTLTHNEKVVANAEPSLVSGVWTLGWSVASKTADEIASEASSVRYERDELLTQCDWTQMPDSPLDDSTKASWATYRTALRDITEQTGFPTNIDWPTAP